MFIIINSIRFCASGGRQWGDPLGLHPGSGALDAERSASGGSLGVQAVPGFVASEWLFASVSSRPLGSALGYLAFIAFGWLNIYVVGLGAEVPNGLWTPRYSTISR